MLRESEQLRLHLLLLSQPVEDSLSLLQTLSQEHSWLFEGVKELASTPLPQWQGEYTRLFISGYPKTAAPPFESAYRHQGMFGPVVGDLIALYRRAGLSAERMPADYLGVELECALYLAVSKQAESYQLLQQLWCDHLLHWLPAFANDLLQQSRLMLYRQWGEQLNQLCMTGSTRAHA
jgi:TorA maturation chaperone TorD